MAVSWRIRGVYALYPVRQTITEVHGIVILFTFWYRAHEMLHMCQAEFPHCVVRRYEVLPFRLASGGRALSDLENDVLDVSILGSTP